MNIEDHIQTKKNYGNKYIKYEDKDTKNKQAHINIENIENIETSIGLNIDDDDDCGIIKKIKRNGIIINTKKNNNTNDDYIIKSNKISENFENDDNYKICENYTYKIIINIIFMAIILILLNYIINVSTNKTNKI